MEVLNEFLKTKGIYSLVMILFFLGVYGMVLSKNYMKKLMAMNVMQVAVIYFYLCLAQKDGAMIPILNGSTTDPNAYINPWSDAYCYCCKPWYYWCSIGAFNAY